MIDAMDKSSKVFVDVMDRINLVQLDIDKSKQHNFKEHLNYLKESDRKAHKMTKNMVSVLLNLSVAMCHAFIKH